MFKLKLNLICGGALMLMASCGSKNAAPELTDSGLDPNKFVAEVDGKSTGLYVLKNAAGMEVCITNYGGRIVSISVPDRDGKFIDVTLGLDSVQAYFPENNQTDFGAAIGRYANRIDHGRLPLGGDTIQLPTNNFGHTLHGGPTGWQYKVYDVNEANDSTLVLSITSPDGDNNFPGEVTAQVTYTLTADNALDIDYEAVTDKPTVINMTNHTYFNLNGEDDGSILDNVLQIRADSYLEVNKYLIPCKKSPVKDTPFDFTEPKAIGEDIEEDFEQLLIAGGYDHNYCLNDYNAATVYSPSTGICMDVYTDCCGMQFYTGNFLEGQTGKSTYEANSGFCLETQYYPNAINITNDDVEKPVLKAGDKFHSRTEYVFTLL